MDAVIVPALRLTGALSLPTDKAICHRAALACALAEGVTEISPWSAAADCGRTLAIVEGLGVRAERAGEMVRIHGAGLGGLRAPPADLDCGESGTTMRLACGLLAGQPFTSRLIAAPSLARRPMGRIIEPLSQMGASIEGRRTDGARGRDVLPPLAVTGRRPLRGIRYAMPVASAQVKSAILFAGLFADHPTTVVEPAQTRDHTERMLRRLGARVEAADGAVTVARLERALQAPGRVIIPGDVSSAAFFLVAASIVPGSTLVLERIGLNPTRTHLIDVLRRMGASIVCTADEQAWEPMGTIRVEARPLQGTAVSAAEAPYLIDELPILMVAACAAAGRTTFEGLGELRVKETDRLHAMTTGLRALGAEVLESSPAGVEIRHSRLAGAAVDAFGDHRTAMSLAVAGLIAKGRTTIRGAECVEKSFGSFFELLGRVTGPGCVTLSGSAPSGPSV